VVTRTMAKVSYLHLIADRCGSAVPVCSVEGNVAAQLPLWQTDVVLQHQCAL
jgi:hypothetical protein